MAKVLLLSSASGNDFTRPYPYDELGRMKRSAASDKHGVHTCTDDPEHADIILFVENCGTIRHYLEARKHPYVRAYRDKCFLFSKYDHPIPFLPGVYASIEKRWYAKQRTRSGGYLKAFGHDFVDYDPTHRTRDYLYSFLGSSKTHPVRKEILALNHFKHYLLDTSQFWPYGELENAEKKKLEDRYVDVSQRSQFILCPRGRGASSIRLFETMRMGRAPVIVADAWVPPEGPDWGAFSLRIEEDEVQTIPDVLAEHESRAEEMGRLARKAWGNWFSVESTFHRATNWCIDIKHSREWSESLLRYSVLTQLLTPMHLKALARILFPKRLVEAARENLLPQ